MDKKKLKNLNSQNLQIIETIKKKNVTIVLPLEEIIHHYSCENLSNSFNIAK